MFPRDPICGAELIMDNILNELNVGDRRDFLGGVSA